MIIKSKYGIYENKKLLNISFNSKDEAKAYVNSKFKHLEDNNKASNYIFNDFVNSKIKEKHFDKNGNLIEGVKND
jgi:hypothetical protein